MPLYRDDQGNIYHSHNVLLTGEAVRPGPIRMLVDAWPRLAQVKPEWVERLPRAALALVALSVLLLLALVPLWLLVGPVAGVAVMIGVCLILSIGYHLVLAMASNHVPMDRPLHLMTPQPGGLIALEMMHLWGALIPLAGVIVMGAQDEDRADMVPWMLLALGGLTVAVLVLNVRFVLRLRRGAAAIRVVG
ncbi:hypothetical protein CHU95_07440 [Niveispirillum lacus]|uniref:Uncharacterized protein n=1 Tax=Niveispirillum lacus TaxID=1981099 RepID=A0A255Z291_9PROT|nr:hypothetical protein [Niveispirillum lacus]OYQ35551.1 hypothetical protein CHU95_07440 [Niveispirillum lacus]